MYAEVAAKSFRDRLTLSALGGAGVGLMALLAVVMYESMGVDTSFVDDLPEVLQSLMGITPDVNYVVGEMFGVFGPIIVLVVAISAGVAAIAGEEQAGTANLLFTQPVTRRGVVASKALVLVGQVALTSALFLSGALLAGAFVDVGVSAAHMAAAAVHLAVFGIAFAMIALALSAGTGSRSTALGVSSALAVGAYLVNSVVPLVNGAEDLDRLSPWYYYDGASPLLNGLDLAHLGVLLTIALVGFGVAMFTVGRRDLSSGGSSRKFSLTGRFERLGRLTRPRVGGLVSFAVWRRSSPMLIAGGALLLFGVAMGAMYPGIEESLREAFSDLPDAMASLVGSSDLASPEGWMNAEMFSLVAPFAVLAVAATIGAGALAGEIHRRRMASLLALPVKRSHVVLANAAAVATAAGVISVFTGLGVAAGSPIGGMDLDMANVAAVSAQLAALGLFFGMLALALGAMFSQRLAIGATIGVALVAFLAETILSINDRFETWSALSPWHYYSANDPLVNGFNLWYLAVLVGLSAVALVVAVVAFERRDAGG